MNKLGLIAGNRSFPLHVAKAARAQGYEVVAVGLKEETEASLEREVDRMHWVSFAQIGQVPELLKKEGVKELILAGQIRPERLLGKESQFDGMVKQLLHLIPDRSGNSAMKMAVKYLEAQGFKVLHSGTFLKSWIPDAGLLTRRAPTPEEKADLDFGFKLVRQLARLSVGQTLVVRKQAVVAVEAMEGTDATIRRSGEVAGKGCVVVKACEMDHDMRFDIPVVGVETLQAMQEAGAACLGIESGRSLLLDQPAFIQEADKLNLTIVAV